VAIYKFSGERVSSEELPAVDSALNAAKIGLMVGFFLSDIVDAYAEIGVTISEERAAAWSNELRLPVQQAMREAGRNKIRELVRSYNIKPKEKQEVS
jgi:hypothetical protein